VLALELVQVVIFTIALPEPLLRHLVNRRQMLQNVDASCQQQELAGFVVRTNLQSCCKLSFNYQLNVDCFT